MDNSHRQRSRNALEPGFTKRFYAYLLDAIRKLGCSEVLASAEGSRADHSPLTFVWLRRGGAHVFYSRIFVLGFLKRQLLQLLAVEKCFYLHFSNIAWNFHTLDVTAPEPVAFNAFYFFWNNNILQLPQRLERLS